MKCLAPGWGEKVGLKLSEDEFKSGLHDLKLNYGTILEIVDRPSVSYF